MFHVEFPSPNDALCLVPSFVDIGRVVLEKILNFVNELCYSVIISPLIKGVTLHLKVLKSHFPKDALCQIWFKLDEWFRRRKFLNFVDEYRNFIITVSPFERGRNPIIWIFLNSLHPRILSANAVKLDQWFKRRFLYFVNEFRYFVIITPKKS